MTTVDLGWVGGSGIISSSGGGCWLGHKRRRRSRCDMWKSWGAGSSGAECCDIIAQGHGPTTDDGAKGRKGGGNSIGGTHMVGIK